MPGLIAVAGAEGSRALVERSARPLLRRPWQSLSTVTNAGGRVTLGLAGERGGVASDPENGVLVAFDGELFDDGVRSGAEAAALVLAGYRDQGARFDPPEGWYAAAVWDPDRASLILMTDRMGHRPVYAAREGARILAASELKVLVAAGLAPRIDLQAWAELLAYEYALGKRTPLAGVELVPPATTLTLFPDGTESSLERWRYQLEPADHGDERELLEELGRLLEQAIDRRLEPSSALALSGGLDSRCLAAILGVRAPSTLGLSWGTPGSEDLEIGSAVAALLGLPHRRLPLEPGYIGRGAAETVWLAEGHVRCFHAHHLALRPVRALEQRRSLLIGFGGDPVLRAFRGMPAVAHEDELAPKLHAGLAGCLSDELLDVVLAPRFAAEIRGLARESLARHLAAEEGDAVARVRQYIWRHSHRRKVLPGAELFLDDLAPRDPYDDRDLIDFCRRMPEVFRRGGYLERSYLRRFPTLATLPSPKDGLPPALTGRRQRLAAHGVKTRRWARAAFERGLGVRWLPNRRGLGDYASDLRRASGGLLELLLEPRTLARGQLREEPVRQLVKEALAGRARHTRPLGMLLTLELFQRQLVDGDPPPPVEPLVEPTREGADALV